ncbi:hypothetical protein EB796_016648 [Bugula neritina]|uniref:MARVEL domain-containing protein n=1 Tax=Bugula neritina TaxID=10212 RepID=A0A7J7JHG2_BUGNE|nr:hypothetical protein EB796_016648 [Bugula neritina]
MVKEVARTARPKSVYDNVQYSPNKPPSWQYYRCMSVVIKLFELIFSGLVFAFASIWVQNRRPDGNYAPSIWVVLSALISLCITCILFLCLLCCVIWLVKKASGWFCFEFFLHIFMIVLWFVASMVSIIYAVMYPEYYVICACVFSFFAQLMYSVDCNMQFVYWRESKRRDIYKHSQPLFNDTE